MGLTCDVLIVGGGGAALRAAIAACESRPPVRVLLVTKGRLGASGVTATACSDRMAFHATLPTTEPGGPDAWRYHADDIYRLGGRVSDYDLAETLAQNAARAFDDLARWGVPWVHAADGAPDQFVTDGSHYARACYTGPYTANHIEQALLRRLRELPVQMLEHSLAAELLRERGRVIGAAVLDERTGAIQAIGVGAVVLATGGAGQAFAVNVYPPDCTGDGYALAYRAGAELVNMEFIQLGLCSLRTGLACSGSMMRALPRLVNDRDDEFLPHYFPAGTPRAQVHATLYRKGASWPVSANEPSHIIDIAVAAERAAGRRVFLDYARDPIGLDLAAVAERVGALGQETRSLCLAAKSTDSPLARLLAINPPAVAWLAERGVALEAGERVEIAPAVQHFQGGVKIGVRGQTTLPGLYAAGEVAGGQHGANRPGGNALLDSQVMGRLAGASAAAEAAGQPAPPLKDDLAEQVVSLLFAPQGAPAGEVRLRVRAAMSAFCGVRRAERGLRALVDELAALDAAGVAPSASPAEALEALSILQTARLVALAALKRDESRGPHLRFAGEDDLRPLPGDDAHWERYLVSCRSAEGPTVERRAPVQP